MRGIDFTTVLLNRYDEEIFEAQRLYRRFEAWSRTWSPENRHLTWYPEAVDFHLHRMAVVIENGSNAQREAALRWYERYGVFRSGIKDKRGT